MLDFAMEKIVHKGRLEEEGIAPLIVPPAKALEVFEEILRRGRALYPDYGTRQGFPRVYRIIALEKS